MKLTDEEFKRLQGHWYGILRDSGFHDLESIRTSSGDQALKERAFKRFKKIEIIERISRQEYFVILSQKIHDEETVFRNEIDRYILNRHADGAKIKTIMEELFSFGTPRRRNSIRFIIRHYEMKWGIRYYERNKLNIYDRKKA